MLIEMKREECRLWRLGVATVWWEEQLNAAACAPKERTNHSQKKWWKTRRISLGLFLLSCLGLLWFPVPSNTCGAGPLILLLPRRWHLVSLACHFFICPPPSLLCRSWPRWTWLSVSSSPKILWAQSVLLYHNSMLVLECGLVWYGLACCEHSKFPRLVENRWYPP